MNRLHVTYLIAGGGVAGSAAAAAIRERDPREPLMLVGQEINRPYRRGPLGDGYLRHDVSRDLLFSRSPEWFVDHHADLRTGRRVVHLDAPRHTATLDSGEDVSFDALLIAVGASPRPLAVPGATLPNVHYLRTLEDADRLYHAAETARLHGRRFGRDLPAQPLTTGRGRATVVGAGPLGTQIAASLAQLGLAVDLVSAGPWPCHRLVGPAGGRLITRALESHGVVIHPHARPLRLEGDGRVQRVVLPEGTLDCDLLVAAVGTVPNRELLRNTPVAAETAILADVHFRTNVPDVFAAGECAAVFDPLFGKYRQIIHDETAALTGRLAGLNMAGTPAPYNIVNTFTFDVFDVTVRSFGEPKAVAHRLARSGQSITFEFGVAVDGRVAQVALVGHRPADEELEHAAREFVRKRFATNGREEVLKDPAVPLSNVLTD